MIETVWKISREDGQWETERLKAYPYRTRQTPWYGSVGSCGRMTEALLWFYEQTGYPLALQLASRFARYHLTTQPTRTAR